MIFPFFSFLLFLLPILNNSTTSIRVIQYNVEWLFLQYYKTSDCPGNGCSWKNETMAQTHLDHVSKIIKELSPDILNLCEVEGTFELQTLVDSLSYDFRPQQYLRTIQSQPTTTPYNYYFIKGTDSATGQNVGMISRIAPSRELYRTETKVSYPIANSQCGYSGNTTTTGVSKHYITEFQIENISIAFIASHLIAIPTDHTRCAQREGQASVLQEIIMDYISRKYEVIVLGDFNDYDNEIEDINGNKPISMVLDIFKGKAGKYQNQYELFSVSQNVPQEKRFSDWWDSDNHCDTNSINDYSMIDHVLVSPKLQSYIKNVFFFHAYFEYCGKYNSDHYPLVVDFEF